MKKKHIFPLLVMFITVIIFLGYPVLADEDDVVEAGDEVVVDGLIYEVQEGNMVTLTDYQSEALTSLVIPGSITYNQQVYTVTSIEEHTFSCSDTLTEVTIGENITSIGDYAFSECENLQHITFSSTLKDLGRGILSGSDNVEITIDPNNNALHYEKGLLIQNGILLYVSPILEEVVLSDTIHTIDSYAFQNCDYLETITVPGTVGKIEEQAFFQCYGIHSITMENNPDIIIENNAFTDMEETGIIYVRTQEMKQHIKSNPQSYPEGVQVTQIIPYEISYSTDGGTFKETCVTKADNTQTILLPDVEKQGYEFVGWCSDEACQQEPIYQIEEGQCDNVVLYAKWEAVEEQSQQEQEVEEQKEQTSITSKVYELAKQEKSKKEVKETEENKSAINVTTEAESATEAQQILQSTEEGNKEAQQQTVKINEEVSRKKTEAATTEAVEKIVQADQQATQEKHMADNMAAKLLLAAGILLILAGGAHEFSRHTTKREEEKTNEKFQNKNPKETDNQ